MYKIFRLDITMSVNLISIYPSHPPKGDLTKTHHIAQPPLEAFIPLLWFSQYEYSPPFHLQFSI